MSPSSREREYARRRYENWQSKQATRLAAERRARRNALAAVAAVVVVIGAVFATTWLSSGNTGTPSATPSSTASASSTASSGASPSASASTSAAANPCPVPSVKAPATAKKWSTPPAQTLAAGKSWTLTLTTTCGPVVVTLDGAKAPKGVSSTLFLARQGFYDGTPCHRLTTAGIFVLQCGDPTGTGTGGPGYSYGPVENAPTDDVYPAGTLAMARQGGNGNSMGSQFFLVYKASTIPHDAAGGYTVLGKITSGLDVVTKIADGGVAGGAGGDGAPARAISIVSTTVSPG